MFFLIVNIFAIKENNSFFYTSHVKCRIYIPLQYAYCIGYKVHPLDTVKRASAIFYYIYDRIKNTKKKGKKEEKHIDKHKKGGRG